MELGYQYLLLIWRQHAYPNIGKFYQTTRRHILKELNTHSDRLENTFFFAFIGRYILLTKYNLGDQVKKTEMSRTFDMYGEEERCIQVFSGET
jgi:hypothetical protein